MTIVNYDWDDLEDNIVEEYDETGATVAEYTTEPGQFGNVIIQRRNGQDSYYHYDGQGSTLALTNSAGDVTDTYAYSAFGEVTAQTGSTVNPFQYIGQKEYYRDAETGEYAVRRRHLTQVARWLSRDPLLLNGRSRFLYVSNRPTMTTDSSGLIADESAIACECGNALASFLASPPSDGIPCVRKLRECKVHIYCADDCGPVGGLTFVSEGFVHICMPNGLFTPWGFVGLVLHECVHAIQILNNRANAALCHAGRRTPGWPADRDVTIPGLNMDISCDECEDLERDAYGRQARYLFPRDAALRTQFIRAGLCASCRHVCPKYQGGPCPPFPALIPPDAVELFPLELPPLPPTQGGDEHLPIPIPQDPSDLPIPTIPFPL